MAKKKRIIKLVCSKCKRINYYKIKSLKMGDKKLNLKKFCKWCRTHTLHEEKR